MRIASIALISTLTLAACGGGGGSLPLSPTVAPQAPEATGNTAITLSIPRNAPSAASRSPLFISPNVASIAFYDGATLVYVANLSLDSNSQFSTVFAKSGTTTVTPGTCTFTSSTATCTLTLTATVGAHKFDVIMYPVSQGTQAQAAQRGTLDTGTAPTFRGVISSEGEFSMTISPGTNPAQTVTLLGVASNVLFAGPSEGAYSTASTYGFRIEDSTNVQIVQPGSAYDNGPITVTASPSGIVTINPNSFSAPPSSTGDQHFDVTCVNANGGTVTISFNAQTHPNTAYASGLTYSTSNYSGAVIQSFSFICDVATGTVPVTVQGIRQR